MAMQAPVDLRGRHDRTVTCPGIGRHSTLCWIGGKNASRRARLRGPARRAERAPMGKPSAPAGSASGARKRRLSPRASPAPRKEGPFDCGIRAWPRLLRQPFGWRDLQTSLPSGS